MTQSVQVGVIGCGVIGRKHIRSAALAPRCQVVAVADMNAGQAQSAADEARIATVYTDGRELIDDPAVEAVVLALPACARLELALYALEQGKHVLIEKPTGMNAWEVKMIMEAQGGLVAASCASRYRFLESARVLKEFIAAGELGELRSIRYRFIKPASEKPVNPPVWRFNRGMNGGGIMVNWGTYDLDFLFGITSGRLKPLEVSAQAWTVPAPFEDHVAAGSDAETHVAAFVRCEGGTVLSLERGECIASPAEDAWEIIGTLGSLRFSMVPEAGKEIWFSAADAAAGTLPRRIWRGDENYDQPEADLMKDFIDAIADGRQPMGTLQDALRVQSLIDAIYLSSESNAAVKVADGGDLTC